MCVAYVLYMCVQTNVKDISQDNVQQSVLSSYLVDPRIGTQVVNLGCKLLSPLSHLHTAHHPLLT